MSGIDWSKAPVNATHARPYAGGVDFYRRNDGGQWTYWNKNRWDYAVCTDESCCVARPGPWGGEGLPPVGTVCLLRYDNGGWGEALIKYISDTMCVWQWVRPEHEQQNVEWGQSPQHIEFQRIRTQEELLAEARENFIDELVQVTCIRRGEAGLIYDAGYRKVQP